MDLKRAIAFAKKYVIFGDPSGSLGSFEPIKARLIKYNNKDAWEITCNYQKRVSGRLAKIIIDNITGNILEFEILSMG